MQKNCSILSLSPQPPLELVASSARLFNRDAIFPMINRPHFIVWWMNVKIILHARNLAAGRGGIQRRDVTRSYLFSFESQQLEDTLEVCERVSRKLGN
ncbi:hypothetical protein KM043_007781 [Ampulex compressa]|nr:hypothetical protein KM043_007781 [Ampulex compressa]